MAGKKQNQTKKMAEKKRPNPHHPQSFQNKGRRELATGFSTPYLLGTTQIKLHMARITQANYHSA